MKPGADFSPILREKILHFNGGLFEHTKPLPITADQLQLLIEAARVDWREVEPAIFGTLLERALDPRERHKLGAHYTPHSYVERLVNPTIIEPLTEEYLDSEATAALLQGMNREHREQTDRPHGLTGEKGNMPWKPELPMDQKQRFVSLAQSGHFTISELCEKSGISRKTGHKWLKRHRESGNAGLADRSRAPKHVPGRTSTAIERLIVTEKRLRPTWGPKKSQRVLTMKHGIVNPPAVSTVGEVLKRHGLGRGTPTAWRPLQDRAGRSDGSHARQPCLGCRFQRLVHARRRRTPRPVDDV